MENNALIPAPNGNAASGKKISLGKLALGGIGVVVTAPIWVPLYCAGVVGLSATRMALKYPRTTFAGMVAAGALWYFTNTDSGKDNGPLKQATNYIQNARVHSLEQRLNHISRQQAQPSQAVAATHHPGWTISSAAYRPLEALTNPGHYAYFAQYNESMEDIASRITGTPYSANALRSASNMWPSTQPMTGQLIWVPDYLAHNRTGLFTQIPKLNQVILKDRSLRNAFGNEQTLAEVVALNNKLGVPYSADSWAGYGKSMVVWTLPMQ